MTAQPDGTVMLPVTALGIGDSPRLRGLDLSHVQSLADSFDDLPPLLVQRSTMRIVDGRHRLAAARLNGARTLPALWFQGSDADAFVTAVRLNNGRGLPLGGHERSTAAARILASHPHRSDRWIASVCGVAPRTVAALRRRPTGDERQLDMRTGRDGRRRPLSAEPGRRIAAEIMRREPEASLRTVARQAGISVGTALDVRRRLAEEDGTATPEPPPLPAAPVAAPSGPVSPAAVREQLDRLVRDPSLRYSSQGRALLRLASATLAFTEQAEAIAGSTAGHSRESLHLIARACAEGWARFGEYVVPEADSAA
ncbi:ParB/RepB/Spo0J family partition protein [Streptomyces sp. HB132]|uniref:ParB/RepB/Spo0J family partition protein n=1 Tax=Streptomyces sp. HB132 TaxID=767388 RepID=UPI0019604251|nr:ParB/RepB/Spo0J family partition protein [Streptomyces sp. HB132]MBM7437315.1 ParB-like chromosome segregation protein Spo0J [Streptomyces sp. HB132]